MKPSKSKSTTKSRGRKGGREEKRLVGIARHTPSLPLGAFALEISAEVGDRWVPFLHRQLIRAHHLLRPVLHELSLAIVNDRQMGQLHQEFLSIAGPTDVLTFELEHNNRGRCVAGEVVICLPEARRNAAKLGTRIEHELLLYALHGMLHLHGFDDKNKFDFMKMHSVEDDILQRLGLGKVFTVRPLPQRKPVRQRIGVR